MCVLSSKVVAVAGLGRFDETWAGGGRSGWEEEVISSAIPESSAGSIGALTVASDRCHPDLPFLEGSTCAGPAGEKRLVAFGRVGAGPFWGPGQVPVAHVLARAHV